MKREIKFRVWLGTINKMTYSHTLDEISYIVSEWEDSDIPLQYTGIKDKNGVEIYEGDIYRLRDDPEEVYPLTEGLLEFGYFFHDYIIHEDDIEVIGNVYENIELLQ